MSEIELLRAVAEAADAFVQLDEWQNVTPGRRHVRAERLRDCLSALAAHRAAAKLEPEGEVQEVRGKVWQDRRDGHLFVVSDGLWVTPPHSGFGYVATIVARVPLPVVPTIKAEVEAP